MTKRDLATVGCKILGLYYFAQALMSGVLNITAVVTMLSPSFPAHQLNRGPTVTHSLFPGFVMLVIVGCIFWFAADSLACLIAPEEPERT